MNTVRDIVRAEHMKLNHTFGRKLAVIAPLLTFLLALFLTTGMRQFFSVSVWNWWYVMMMPGMMAAFCCLLIKKDKKNKYYHILSLPMPPEASWFGKIVYCAFTLLFSNLVISLGTAAASIFFGVGISPLSGFLAALILSISGLWMIPLLLFLSARFGMFVSMFIGIFLFVFGTGGLADTAYWWIIPASVPMRLMCPVLGILPNGLPVPAGSAMLDRSVILPGILLSLLWFIVLTFLTTKWFQRKGAE